RQKSKRQCDHRDEQRSGAGIVFPVQSREKRRLYVWCERSGSRSSVLNRLSVCGILTPESSRRHLSVTARRPLVVLICGRRIGGRRTEPRLWNDAGIDARLCHRRSSAKLFDCALKLTGGLKARLGAFCERAHYGLFEDE